MSETCQAVAFGHSTGSLHLFGKGENCQFNSYSVQTLFVDPVSMKKLDYLDYTRDICSTKFCPPV